MCQLEWEGLNKERQTEMTELLTVLGAMTDRQLSLPHH